jgi:hypothetical protein
MRAESKSPLRLPPGGTRTHTMFPRVSAVLPLLVCLSAPVAALGQETSAAPVTSPSATTGSPATTSSDDSATPAAPVLLREFPVLMQQNVVAGKTQVGTKVQAKLWIATLLEGKVIPRNAVFSGEVVESSPKTKTEASSLSIRMDSVQWKDGSAPIKVYLTNWYYPSIADEGQNLQYGPLQSQKATWNGQGAYPDPNSRSYKPFPGTEENKDSTVPATPSSATSHHRVAMKEIEAAQSEDGVIQLSSKRINIKLDKLTTYVLSTGEPVAIK